mmetsp:Transcript_4600/g.8956  ORF Transcript_4600/g.8956 Transcript_4600/m.8956 type:complete len:89 (+) Transcript_4600:749-1015(+)
MPLEELMDAYALDGGNVAPGVGAMVVCEGGNLLSEVRLCLGKGEDGLPTGRIGCPQETIIRGQSCDNTVTIPNFDVDKTDCAKMKMTA